MAVLTFPICLTRDAHTVLAPSGHAAAGVLFLSSVSGRLAQREKHDLLAGRGADVVVQAQHLGASGLFYQNLHDWPCRLDEVGSHLLEQVPSLFCRKCLDQLLLSRG
jgi:hypothetical protein